jgi:hypothetical protein
MGATLQRSLLPVSQGKRRTMPELKPLQRYGAFNCFYSVEEVKAREKLLADALRKWAFTRGTNLVCNCCERQPHKPGCELGVLLAQFDAEEHQ